MSTAGGPKLKGLGRGNALMSATNIIDALCYAGDPTTNICYDSSRSGYTTLSQNKDWKLSSRIQYKFNTLVLTRGDVYHAGSNGWGDSIENGRMIQTFFFKEKDES